LVVKHYSKVQSLLFFLLITILFNTASIVEAEFIADGVKLVPLTDDGKSSAVSWSCRGDLICIVRQETSAQRQLLIMKSDGTGERAITPIGNPFFAEWSWDGTKISYEFSNADDDQSQAQVFVFDLVSNKSISVSSPYPLMSVDVHNGPFWSADSRYVAYSIENGSSGKSQVWVSDALTGKRWRILTERGESREQRWSPMVPPKLCLLVEASGGGFDLADANPMGKEFVLLTSIGGQSVDVDDPHWSPTGQWIAYNSDIDMTQTERDYGLYEQDRADCFICRPDGTLTRNLTNATSAATEEQLSLGDPIWSWDGRWILSDGDRFDNQGNSIGTIYLIDPVNGGYEPIFTSYPRETAQYNNPRSIKWSYDSKKIAILTRRWVVKNWGPDAQYEKLRWILGVYDIRTRRLEELLVYDEQQDLQEIIGRDSRRRIEDISWSPDNRSILLTIAKIISSDDNISKPDVYRLDLPERLISPSASQHIGPPIGNVASNVPATTTLSDAEQTGDDDLQTEDWSQVQIRDKSFVTDTLRPMHMTVEEAAASLPDGYAQYVKANPARNILLFKGPSDVLEQLRKDMNLVDTPAPHILVDLLAVELSDSANRSLGLDWAVAEDHFGFYQPAGSPVQKYGRVGTDEDYRAGFPSGALDELYRVPGAGQSFYQGVGELPSEFFIRLNTLVEDGEGTILANPRTVAMSGKESLINIRKTLNYFYDEGFDVAGRPIVRKSDISADTEGRIVPTLLADGTIHLVVDVQVGNYTFTPDQGLPQLTTRQSTTEVNVREGQTLVLGGLRQQEMGNTVTKVPFLGDLPVLGFLFKHEEEVVKNSVLTIFITPHILEPESPAPEWPQLNPEDHKIVPIMKRHDKDTQQ